MSWSLNIGKGRGTVVRVHIAFVLFLAWILASSYASSGATAARNTLLFVVLLFLCVLLHEFGHIFTTRAFGVSTPYVTLLPVGGIAQLERIPEEPWEKFLIALAGPAVNVVIAAVLIVFAHAHRRATTAIGVDEVQIAMVDRLAAVNLPACAASASKAGQIARPISTAERSASLASRSCSMFCLTSRRTKLLLKSAPAASGKTKGRLAFLGGWSAISPRRREAARVAHEALDQQTSSRRPMPESDRWCSSR